MMSIYLQHHGILGQRWGVRRYQNEDGSYTPEGRKRYNVPMTKQYSAEQRSLKTKIHREQTKAIKELETSFLSKYGLSVIDAFESGKYDQEVNQFVSGEERIYAEFERRYEAGEEFLRKKYGIK